MEIIYLRLPRVTKGSCGHRGLCETLTMEPQRIASAREEWFLRAPALAEQAEITVATLRSLEVGSREYISSKVYILRSQYMSVHYNMLDQYQ